MDRNQIITDAATEIMDRIEFRRGILRSDLEAVVGSALDRSASAGQPIAINKVPTDKDITEALRGMGYVKYSAATGQIYIGGNGGANGGSFTFGCAGGNGGASGNHLR